MAVPLTLISEMLAGTLTLLTTLTLCHVTRFFVKSDLNAMKFMFDLFN